MSLIIDTLNKVETKEFKNHIPPNLLKKNPNSKSTKKTLIYIGLFFTLSFPTTFLFNQIENLQQDNIKTSTVALNVPETQPVSIAKNTPTFNSDKSNKVTEINSLEKDLNQLDNLNIPNVVFNSVKENIENLKIEVKKSKKIKRVLNKETTKDNIKFKFNSYISIAENYLKENDIQNSLKWFKKAYQIKKDEYVLLQLLNLYLITNNWKYLNSLLPELKDEKSIYSFLIQLINRNQIENADKILTEKIKFDKNGYLLYVKGLILEDRGDFKKAEKFYKKAYEKNNLDPYLAYSYGRILEINKKYTKALNIYLNTKNLHLDKNLQKTIQQRISILRKNNVL
jgi:tetratricopeptide (TPR) repeat protein